MAEQSVRVGIVGAGANTRARHLPGLQTIAGVDVVAVANRTIESTARVARDFHIPRTHDNWRAIVEADDIDAVVVGTWPNLHCEVTCAALAAGKHVLCEARMARNLAEAQQMQQAAAARPDLVAQLVPSPYGLRVGPLVQRLISERFLGTLREVVVLGVDDSQWDYSNPLHWRQDRELSGLNILSLGILHETVLRWAPRPTQVFAQTATFEPTRPDLSLGRPVNVTVPDHVHVLTQMENGERGLYHFSGVSLFGPGKQIQLYGSRGTMKVQFEPDERLFVGRRGTDLREATLAEDQAGQWRVEAEFIAAIRGQGTVQLTDFDTGVEYMQFIEAVSRSAESGTLVHLPL